LSTNSGGRRGPSARPGGGSGGSAVLALDEAELADHAHSVLLIRQPISPRCR
jgi:hypothetical protein